MPHFPSFCLISHPFASFCHHVTAARGAPKLGPLRRFRADSAQIRNSTIFSPFSPFLVQSLTGKNDITPLLVTGSFYFFHQSREGGTGGPEGDAEPCPAPPPPAGAGSPGGSRALPGPAAPLPSGIPEAGPGGCDSAAAPTAQAVAAAAGRHRPRRASPPIGSRLAVRLTGDPANPEAAF